MMDFRTLLDTALNKGWSAGFALFDKMVASLTEETRAAVTDSFFLECLACSGTKSPDGSVWAIAGKWHGCRNLSTAGHNLTPLEEDRVYHFMTLLRSQFDRELASDANPLPELDEGVARTAILLWRDIFLSSFSVLNQRNDAADALLPNRRIGGMEIPHDDYCWLLRMSMYHPFDADHFAVDVERLLVAGIPAFAKVILTMWLVNVPRYNATQFHRQKVLQYFPVIVRQTRILPAWMDPFFHLLAEWLMLAMFRLAYIHDDNSGLTCRFGDFIVLQMGRFLPQFCEPRVPSHRPWKSAGRIRIGYVSTKFVANAVTFYMANRILQRDRNTFEIQVFALGNRQDGMTDLLAQNCDRFVRIENSMDYAGIARAIVDSELDILLFTDIGMEINTYLLAGLRLAPLQGALLGHASSTGLATIDFFFSSEVDPADAQPHYREKLIRLPNVGAAQIMPPGLQPGLTHSLTRQNMGIPDSAFVFVSCANGMKHVPERDYIWVEILRKIPHAWILIKPFNPGDYDRKLIERIDRAGKLAGAPERIRYIAGCDSHNEVFALLGLANAQLDTYPFNGWTTTIEAFCLALPTVTQEGKAYRSRIGATFLRSMGITEGIAADDAAYIEWARRFASDQRLCQWVKNRIKATRKNLLFENASLQMEYEKALIELVRDQGGRGSCG